MQNTPIFLIEKEQPPAPVGLRISGPRSRTGYWCVTLTKCVRRVKQNPANLAIRACPAFRQQMAGETIDHSRCAERGLPGMERTAGFRSCLARPRRTRDVPRAELFTE